MGPPEAVITAPPEAGVRVINVVIRLRRMSRDTLILAQPDMEAR